MNKNNIVTFLDSVGRTLFAEKADDSRNNDDFLIVKNPVVVHINQDANSGQMSLSLIPCFFREFLADKSQDTVWAFNKNTITMMDSTTFDEKLYKNYSSLNSLNTDMSTSMEPKVSVPDNKGIIKLFDDEK